MMLNKLSGFLLGTLRGRLIVGVFLVQTVIMALFIGDLTMRQRAMLLEHQTEEAAALSKTLAVSSAGWIAADDIAGLQELVEAKAEYPEILFVMIADERGCVLADTDKPRRGLYMLDLPAKPVQTVLSRTPAMVDVITPAMIKGRHVGWARIGIGQNLTARKLAQISRDGVIYALAAILAGLIIALSMGGRITRRLYAIQKTIDAVRSGNHQARSNLAGTDEAAVMAREFNSMLDALAGLNTELGRSEERFRSLFENLPVSIWEEDFSAVKMALDSLREQGVEDVESYLKLHPEMVQQCAEMVRIIDVNLAALELHEATGKTELLKGLLNTFTPESYSAFREQLIVLWHGETALVRDTVVKTTTGAYRDVTLYFSVCPGHEQTLSRIMVSLIDITERRAAEAKLERLNEELEYRVKERTAALEESQQALMNIVEDLNDKTAELEQANSRLQEVDQLKSMFIASMSHELRTPLNSIIGFSSILHDEWVGPVNDEQKKNLAIILRCGKHLLNLINDVIDVSKIEAGKIDSVFEEFDLYDLIDEAVSQVRKELEAKGLALRMEADSQLMCTDRRRLLQCVLNLLSNAMKYTEKGDVCVEAHLVTPPGKRPEERVVEISVTDTGIGIKAEDLPNTCQPFVRFASEIQLTVPGTGLGLYLTRKLVAEVLKGDLIVTSEYGKGSRIAIKIPERIS